MDPISCRDARKTQYSRSRLRAKFWPLSQSRHRWLPHALLLRPKGAWKDRIYRQPQTRNAESIFRKNIWAVSYPYRCGDTFLTSCCSAVQTVKYEKFDTEAATHASLFLLLHPESETRSLVSIRPVCPLLHTDDLECLSRIAYSRPPVHYSAPLPSTLLRRHFSTRGSTLILLRQLCFLSRTLTVMSQPPNTLWSTLPRLPSKQ